ncbi:MAG: hypothetical protein WBP86_03965 [Thiobacillaceae bacterium]
MFIGAPLFWGFDYPYPYAYYYPPYETSWYPPPATYIEQGDEEAALPLESGYWYYCTNPPGYYPYVQQCPAGWRPVAPQPPP